MLWVLPSCVRLLRFRLGRHLRLYHLPHSAELALVDDVLNSGRTLLWAVIKLMGFRPQVLSTTVLVDRSHKRYPVKADIKGLSLSTTLQDTVQLNVVGGKAVNVYLV